MKLQCPKCRTNYSIPREYISKTIKCKNCNQLLKVTSKTAEPKPICGITEENQMGKKKSPGKQNGENFLTKLWRTSPSAFRVTFLGTLGVFSAFLFIYYIWGAGLWLKGYTAAASSKTTRFISPNIHLDYIAAAMLLDESYMTMDMVVQIDFNAKNRYWAEDNYSAFCFLNVLLTTQQAFEELYARVKNFDMPPNENLKKAHRDLLALTAIYQSGQNKLIEHLQNSNDYVPFSSFHNRELLSCTDKVETSRLKFFFGNQVDYSFWETYIHIKND